MLNLAKAFAAWPSGRTGVCRAQGALLSEVPASIPVITLKRSRLTARLAPLFADIASFGSLLRPVLLARNPATLRYLVDLARYLKRRQPRAPVCASPVIEATHQQHKKPNGHKAGERGRVAAGGFIEPAGHPRCGENQPIRNQRRVVARRDR